VSEPFLDKRVIPLCEDFNRRIPHGYLRLFTNGSTLTDANVERIAGLKNVLHLWISLNEYRPKEYEELMGLDFERTTANLDRLHKRGFPHPVVVSTVGLPNMAFKAYVAKRWPRFSPAVLKRDAWIDFIDPQSPEVPDAACSRWWELSITATGEVALCCMDGASKYPIGNVNTQTLLEVYNQPMWRDRRLNNVSRKTVADPCNRCSY
jgi:radical SAM protein with 4Fe4S-binding SPASM domain